MSGITNLDALNRVLASKGIQPVLDYDSLHPAAALAREQIGIATAQVIQEFDWFATDYSLILTQDGNGRVLIPAGTTSIDPVDSDSKLIVRGEYFYDPVNNTFEIGQDVECTVRFDLTWDDYPSSVRLLIMWEAVRLSLMDRQDAQDKIKQLNEVMIPKARLAVQRDRMRIQDVNLRDRPHVQRALSGRALSWSGRFSPNYPGGLLR